MFYGLIHDPELISALNDDGDSEDDSETPTDKEGKEKPKVCINFQLKIQCYKIRFFNFKFSQ